MKRALKSIFSQLLHILQLLGRICKTCIGKPLWLYVRYHTDRFNYPRNFADLWFRLAFRFVLIGSTAVLLVVIGINMTIPEDMRTRYLLGCISPVYLFSRKRLVSFYLTTTALILYIIGANTL